MTGKQVLRLKNYYSPQALKEKLEAYGAAETAGCTVCKAAGCVFGELVCIPATEHYQIAAVMRRKGLFSRANRLALFVCDAASGHTRNQGSASVNDGSILGGIKQFNQTLSRKEERTGPAEAALLAVTARMREIFREELL